MGRYRRYIGRLPSPRPYPAEARPPGGTAAAVRSNLRSTSPPPQPPASRDRPRRRSAFEGAFPRRTARLPKSAFPLAGSWPHTGFAVPPQDFHGEAFLPAPVGPWWDSGSSASGRCTEGQGPVPGAPAPAYRNPAGKRRAPNRRGTRWEIPGPWICEYSSSERRRSPQRFSRREPAQHQ